MDAIKVALTRLTMLITTGLVIIGLSASAGFCVRTFAWAAGL